VIHVYGNHQNINRSGVRSNNKERTRLSVCFENVTAVLTKDVADREPQIRRQLRLGELLEGRKENLPGSESSKVPSLNHLGGQSHQRTKLGLNGRTNERSILWVY
jgi:hypothetical protein